MRYVRPCAEDYSGMRYFKIVELRIVVQIYLEGPRVILRWVGKSMHALQRLFSGCSKSVSAIPPVPLPWKPSCLTHLRGMLTASGTPPAFAARRDIDHGSELVRVQTEGSKLAFGPCQVQPAPTAPPRPARAGGPRGDAICQERPRLTDPRHHVSVKGRPSRSLQTSF